MINNFANKINNFANKICVYSIYFLAMTEIMP